MEARRHGNRGQCPGPDRLRPSSGGSGGEGGWKTLTVWSWRVEDEAAYNKIFDVYEKSHEGITVNFKPFKATEYNKILATGLAGSDGPDVPQVRSYGQLQTTVASGSLVPLDGKVDLSGWDETVLASAKGKEDGKVYSVPFARQATVMFYNKDVFEKNGLSVPATWDEFMAANKKLPPRASRRSPSGPRTTGPSRSSTRCWLRRASAAPPSTRPSPPARRTSPTPTGSRRSRSATSEVHAQERHGRWVTDAQTLFSGKAAMFPGAPSTWPACRRPTPR